MAWGMLVLLAAACGGDDTSSSETSQTEADAAIGASAGKSGSSTSAGSKPTASDSVDAAVSTSMKDTATTGGKGGTKGQAAMAGSRSGQPADDHEDAGISTDGKGGDAGSGTAGQAGASAGDTATDSDPSKGAVTFTKVYALFATTCAGAKCHVNADEAGDVFSMSDQTTAYVHLVNADAVRCVGAKRVVPGDPDKSQLVHALQHTSLSGCEQTPKMPAGQPMLRQTDIDLVLSWIKNGATNE
jgi:hypothetical protein